VSIESFSFIRKEFRLSWVTHDKLIDYSARELTLKDEALRDLVFYGYDHVYMPEIVYSRDARHRLHIDPRQCLAISERIS
jgi:hypothetical protein